MNARWLVVLVASCGATHTPAPAPHHAPIIAAPSATATASAAPAAPARPECWSFGEKIVQGGGTGDPVTTPVPSAPYPLVFPLITAAESERRAAALHARYPNFTFHVSDLGVVSDLATDRMPCEVKDEVAKVGYLTMKTQDVVRSYLAAVSMEMPDVPFLTDYGVQPKGNTFTLRQTRDIPPVLANQLPKTELDDAALIRKWAGARVQWFRPVEHTKVTPIPNPCLHSTHVPCDPPGPIVETTTSLVLRGEKPIAPRYVESIERTTVAARTPAGFEIRRVAYVHVNDITLGEDLFGLQQSNLEGQYGLELRVTGTDQRDAITGDALPAHPH